VETREHKFEAKLGKVRELLIQQQNKKKKRLGAVA
jgi:hypothetical protein